MPFNIVEFIVPRTLPLAVSTILYLSNESAFTAIINNATTGQNLSKSNIFFHSRTNAYCFVSFGIKLKPKKLRVNAWLTTKGRKNNYIEKDYFQPSYHFDYVVYFFKWKTWWIKIYIKILLQYTLFVNLVFCVLKCKMCSADNWSKTSRTSRG